MQKWKYLMLRTYWEESERIEENNTRISYRHVWMPDDEVKPYFEGMTADLGEEGWELTAAVPISESLPTLISRQGNHQWGSFTSYQLFFKQPNDQ